MSDGVEQVVHEGNVIAIIIRAAYSSDGIEFFTPHEFSQQLAYMNRPAGYRIDPHVHNEVRRSVSHTLEVLIVRSGKIQLDLYDDDRNYVEDRILNAGDIILLASGGHGVKMIEASEIVEVKQGPYAGDHDKTRFVPEGES